MARGWESKAVESQIESAEERKDRSRAVELSEQQIALERQREGLQLSRGRVMDDIVTATNPKYREQLERSLAFLDEKIANLRP